MKTLQECKDQVAKMYGYRVTSQAMCNPSMNDEAAELYASQFKGSEIKIDRLGNTDRPVFEEESQEEIWEEVGKNRDFYGNAVWLKRVQEQFTIQRRP